MISYTEAAGLIDHSLLQPTLAMEELRAGCALAVRYQVGSVCILPYALPYAVEWLAKSSVLPTTTIGFPHGGQTTAAKVAETELALNDGAAELDMVINISKALSGDWSYVANEIGEITTRVHANQAKVKVIFENCFLEDSHKIRLCEICGERGVDWVKTSTGYGSGGATDEDLVLMRTHSPESVQVKAAGGVRDLDRMLHVHSLGVTRVGASRTADILDAHPERPFE